MRLGIRHLLYGLACGWCWACAAGTPPTSPAAFADDLAQLRKYCLGEVCLGMTLAEIGQLGNLPMGITGPTGSRSNLDGMPFCDPEFVLDGIATLETPDAAGFTIGFAIASGQGDVSGRYRAISITRHYSRASERQLDEVRKVITDRLGGMTKNRDGSWSKTVGSFRVSVIPKSSKQSERPAAIPPDQWSGGSMGLHASYSKRAEWLSTLPQCNAPLPKL